MKIDLYTKVILTGIFACLCIIIFRDVRFESRAEAQTLGGTQDVNVVSWRAGDLDVDISDTVKVDLWSTSTTVRVDCVSGCD